MVLVDLFLTSLVVLAWWLTSSDFTLAIVAGLVFLAFSMLDGLLLWSLPRRGLSFGSWQAQGIVLAISRLAACIALSLAAAITSDFWSLLGLIVIQIIGLAALVWGAMIEPFNIQLTTLTITSERVLPGVKPVRVIHISDLHVERLTKREKKLLALVEEVEADLILLTGDYLNLSYIRDRRAQAEVKKLLSKLWAPCGVYAVLGSPPVDERDVVPGLFEELPIELLVDQCQTVPIGAGRRLTLIGMDCTHYLPLDSHRLGILTADMPNDVPSILMYHAPDLFPEAVDLGIDLYLCGHTHGGQVRLPGIGALLTSSQLGRKYQIGLYQEGRTSMYVSRGVGMEGLSAPRVRFLSPPEITLVTIRGIESE